MVLTGAFSVYNPLAPFLSNEHDPKNPLMTLTPTQSQICQVGEEGLHSRLRPVNRVKCLVQEQSHGPTGINPRRTILIQARIVPQQRQEIHDHKRESRQRDEVGRHPHGEALDGDIGVEGLEDVARGQRSIYAAIFVLLEVRQLVLSHVDHSAGCGGVG